MKSFLLKLPGTLEQQLAAEGINPCSYRTCIQSAFVETLGLGRDTRLFIDKNMGLILTDILHITGEFTIYDIEDS